MTLFIYPIAKEILNNGNDLPVSRDALCKFCQKIERENPGFIFDWSYMHALDKIIDHPNLWFLEILQSESLKEELISKCKEGPGPSDIDYVHKVVMDKYMQGSGVEGNIGIYRRVQEIKN